MFKTTFFAAILAFVFAQPICAAESNESDANNFKSQSSRTHWRYRSERVMMNWHDGIQQMVVSPRVHRDTNSLWILPLKCKSDEVKFSLTNDYPYLFGTDCREAARKVLTNVNYSIIATQLWTIPLFYFANQYKNVFITFSRPERHCEHYSYGSSKMVVISFNKDIAQVIGHFNINNT